MWVSQRIDDETVSALIADFNKPQTSEEKRDRTYQLGLESTDLFLAEAP